MPPKTQDIDELQRELEEKLSRLEDLKSQRDEIDREIADLMGVGRSRAKTRGKTGKTRKKTGTTRKAKKRGRRGRGGDKPLVEYIKDVLAQHPEGMRIKEIEQAVKKTGYKSASKDFYGIIATAVRDENHFEKVSRGVYKLKD